MNRLEVSLENGKYTVVQEPNGSVKALRYGEEWRDLTGDKLVLCLAQEVEALQEKVRELEKQRK